MFTQNVSPYWLGSVHGNVVCNCKHEWVWSINIGRRCCLACEWVYLHVNAPTEGLPYMTSAKVSDFLPHPPCHIRKSADFVPFVCFLGTTAECGRHIWKPSDSRELLPFCRSALRYSCQNYISSFHLSQITILHVVRELYRSLYLAKCVFPYFSHVIHKLVIALK